MKHALEGIKVADFTWVATGPLTTKYLADHGAEVVRIESHTRPDGLRVTPPFKDGVEGINRSGYYTNFNSSKYSMSLNLNHPKGVEVAKRLVAWADVVAENFSPKAMKKWGLTYEELRAEKPDIIMISMPLMGQTGPHSAYLGNGYVLQAVVGISHLTGWPDGEPVGPGVAYTDFFVPHLSVVAILAALEWRRRTGRGQYIDLAQFEAAIHCLETAVIDYTANGRGQRRLGNCSPWLAAAPHGAYRCRGDDRWCVIAVFTDEEWKSFCGVIGSPDWAREERFSTLLGRLRNAEALDRLVQGWTTSHSAEEVMTLMQTAGIPAGVVQNARDLYSDPQLKHRHHYWELDHPEMGKFLYDGPSFKLSRTPGGPRTPAPCLGQHTEYVCTRLLGMADQEFIGLLNEGVFE